MGSYSTDRGFADIYLPQQAAILQPVLAAYFPPIPHISSWQRDVFNAADFTVYRHDNVDIGARVRRPRYASIFGLMEFTLRSHRATGTPTEFEKIKNGNGQWFSYFHSDDDGRLPHWLIVDLEGVRLNLNINPGSFRDNRDGTGFRVFDVRRFPVGIMIAASETVTAALPFPYQTAMRRRQMRQWEPYRGARAAAGVGPEWLFPTGQNA